MAHSILKILIGVMLLSAYAKFAYDKACEAIEDGEKGYSFCWHNEWREIYGSRFPNT